MAAETDNLAFIRGLVAEGVLAWKKYPWHEFAQVVGEGLMIHDDIPGVWSIWTSRYTIHVLTIGSDLASAWASLDWESIRGLAGKLDDDFSRTPDF